RLHSRASPTGGAAANVSAAPALALHQGRKRASRMRGAAGGHLVDGTGAHQRTSADAAFGAEIDQPVGAADEVEVVLDGDDGVAGFEQAGERGEQHLDVAAVQAGGRLVE